MGRAQFSCSVLVQTSPDHSNIATQLSKRRPSGEPYSQCGRYAPHRLCPTRAGNLARDAENAHGCVALQGGKCCSTL